MILITCVSAVIATAMVGKKFSLLSTSLVVLISQGLYHLGLSVMTHHSVDVVATQAAPSGHQHGEMLVGNIASRYSAVQSESMLYAHVLAALTSILVLRVGEQLLSMVWAALSLSAVRRVLVLAARIVPEFPKAPANFVSPVMNRLSVFLRLPARRGPPSNVLNPCAYNDSIHSDHELQRMIIWKEYFEFPCSTALPHTLDQAFSGHSDSLSRGLRHGQRSFGP